MSNYRLTREKPIYFCQSCGFSSGRLNNFNRHLESSKHEQNTKLLDLNVVEPEESAISETPTVSCACTSDDDVCVLNWSISSQQRDDPIDDGSDLHDINQTSDEDANDDESDMPTVTEGPHQETIQSEQWFPYKSKLHFLLTVMHSSKTHKVSDEVLSFFLYILKECGIQDVPSLPSLKAFWTEDLNLDDLIQEDEDQNGDSHWMIKPSAILKMVLANPTIAKSIDRYPTSLPPDTKISGSQSSGQKWREMIFHWGEGSKEKQYVVGDVVTFVNQEGKTVLGKIVQFLTDVDNKLCVEVDELQNVDHSLSSIFENIPGTCLVIMENRILIPIKDCRKSSLPRHTDVHLYRRVQSQDSYAQLTTEEKERYLRKNALWNDKPIVKVPLNVFLDDLSGNQSRRWAPVHGIQAQVSGLPLEDKRKSSNVLFLAASESISMMSLIDPVCKDIKICKEIGVDAYDAFLKREVTLTSEIAAIVSDYQMMSLVCNHMGPSANKFCPKCFADKTDPFRLWPLRNAMQTQRTLQRLEITNSNNLQRETGVKLFHNCLWEHLDPHKDSPIGILHFLYLGLAKHLIRDCVSSLSERQLHMLTLHLKSIDQSQFSYRIHADTFFKYLDSRQGKDYKHYLQIAPINMEYAGIHYTYVVALEKLALVSKHLHQHSSTLASDLEDYMNYIKTTIPDLGKKTKTHLCVHIAADMKRHGNPLHTAEDAFEKNHRAIRNGLLHQNGQAKSRDTVVQFAKYELTKHVVSGGYIHAPDKWRQASDTVLSYANEKKIKSFLGMADNTSKIAGQLRKYDRNESRKPKNDQSVLAELEQLMLSCTAGCNIGRDAKFFPCKELYTTSGDVAKVGDFVTFGDEEKPQIATIQKVFLVRTDRDHVEMAILNRCQPCTSYKGKQTISRTEIKTAARSNAIHDVLHVIHDCKRGHCNISERSGNELTLKHSNFNVFMINKFRLCKVPDELVFDQ